MTTKSSVHNHYIKCSCGAEYSDPIEKCPACGRVNPENPTLNGDDPENVKPDSEPTTLAEQPTLNGKDK